MAGNCSIFRSWDTGNLLTASDLTTSFTQVGVTNMTTTCMDDYAVDVNQFRTNTDPYPASVASLPTSLAGELERIRFIFKEITGWSQWYAHTEAINIQASSQLTPPIGVNGTADSNIMLSFKGTWAPATQPEGIRVGSIFTTIANANSFGVVLTPTFTEAASGTHGQLTALYVNPAFTNGVGATTSVFGINIDMGAVGAIAPTNAAGLRIAGPTGATNNYALWVESGNARLDGNLRIGTNPASAGAIRLANAAQIAARNAANGADVNLLALNASDQIQFGAANIVPQADTAWSLGTSALRYTVGNFSTAVAVGTNPAAAGAVRLANAVNLSGRNAANGADVIMAQIDASDRVRIGPQSAGNIRMDGQTRCDIDAAARFVLPVGVDKWAV